MEAKIYEIDFDGYVACKLEVVDNEVKIIAAMNEGGEPIDIRKIRISDEPLEL